MYIYVSYCIKVSGFDVPSHLNKNSNFGLAESHLNVWTTWSSVQTEFRRPSLAHKYNLTTEI